MAYQKPPFNGVVPLQTIISWPLVVVAIFTVLLCLNGINCEPYGGGGIIGDNGNSGGNGGGVGIHIGGANLGSSDLLKCPRVCTCSGQTVDCSHRGLTQVPRRIPLDTERL